MQGYTQFHDREQVRDLNLNDYDSTQATVFPYGLYSGNHMMTANYVCGEHVPRSTESHYIIDRERRQHPDHFSRFGYARTWKGHVGAAHPGRFRENDACLRFEYPPDMAPAKFYLPPHIFQAPHVGRSSSESEAHNRAVAARRLSG